MRGRWVPQNKRSGCRTSGRFRPTPAWTLSRRRGGPDRLQRGHYFRSGPRDASSGKPLPSASICSPTRRTVGPVGTPARLPAAPPAACVCRTREWCVMPDSAQRPARLGPGRVARPVWTLAPTPSTAAPAGACAVRVLSAVAGTACDFEQVCVDGKSCDPSLVPIPNTGARSAWWTLHLSATILRPVSIAAGH